MKTIKNPFLTIITATFNAVELIQKTADSLKKQEFKNFEWIVVDGCSSDSTVEIIKKNQDIVTNWISEPDGGIYDAWNKGLELAQGEWIAFLGAGDFYISNGLSLYIEKIQSASNEIELVSSKIQLVDVDGKYLREIGEQFNFDRHKKFMTIAHVGAFHKKSLFRKFGKFDLRYSSAGDYEYFMRCGANLKTSFINGVTASMLVGGTSSSYSSILEAYKIQNNYGSPILIVIMRGCIALFKNILRPFIRGY